MNFFIFAILSGLLQRGFIPAAHQSKVKPHAKPKNRVVTCCLYVCYKMFACKIRKACVEFRYTRYRL